MVAHVDEIALKDATFKVSFSGRQRVLKEKRKNVHAVVRGIVTDTHNVRNKEVKYNPYKSGQFMLDGAPVFFAASVLLKDNKVYV